MLSRSCFAYKKFARGRARSSSWPFLRTMSTSTWFLQNCRLVFVAFVSRCARSLGVASVASPGMDLVVSALTATWGGPATRRFSLFFSWFVPPSRARPNPGRRRRQRSTWPHRFVAIWSCRMEERCADKGGEKIAGRRFRHLAQSDAKVSRAIGVARSIVLTWGCLQGETSGQRSALLTRDAIGLLDLVNKA